MRRPNLLQRSPVAAALAGPLALLALAASGVAAEGPASGPSLTCTFRFSGRYLPGHWTPVTFRLTNPGPQTLRGDVLIGVGRDNALPVRRGVSVPPHSVVELSGSVRPGVEGKSAGPGEVATAVWRGEQDQELARTALVGDPAPPTVAGATLTVDTLPAAASQHDDSATLAGLVQTASGSTVLNAATVNAEDVPASLADYDAFGQVLLLMPPDALNLAQRSALLAYVEHGGTLVVSGAPADSHLEDSWLAPYLPVRVIGRREAAAVRPRGEATPIRLARPGPVAEALRADGDADGVSVILEDDDFVHLAVRRRGRGRVVFASFMPTWLDPKHPATAAAWRDAWGLDQTPVPPDTAAVAARQQAAMSGVLGRSAPPVWVAIAVCGGFVTLLIGLHACFGGARRPLAFGVGMAAAVVASGGLMGVSAARRGGDAVSAARLTTVRLGTDGRGDQQDLYAFYGPTTPGVGLVAARANVVGRPLENRRDPTPVSMMPFGVPDVGVRPDSSDTVWNATGAVGRPLLLCRGTFTDRGLELKCQNNAATALLSPLLAWGDSLVRVGDVPPGESTAVAREADANPAGVFTHGGLIGQLDRLRGDLIAGLPRFDKKGLGATVEPPALLGWFDPSETPPLLDVHAPGPLLSQGHAMAQVRLAIEPSAAGRGVLVEGPFNGLSAYKNAPAPPTDASGSAALTGARDWVVAVRPPAEVGRLKPTRAVISFDIDAPQYAVTVQARQFQNASPDGKFVPNEQADPVGRWSHPIGHKTVSLDVTSADLSPEGWLVLRFAVESPASDPAAEPLAARWTVQRLRVTLSGTINDPAARNQP